jgi:hypothetical protein
MVRLLGPNSHDFLSRRSPQRVFRKSGYRFCDQNTRKGNIIGEFDVRAADIP